MKGTIGHVVHGGAVLAAGLATAWSGLGHAAQQYQAERPGGIRDEFQELCDEPQGEDTGHGYMEFFDWWAGCTAHELTATAKEYVVMMPDGSELHPASYETMMRIDQEKFAKQIWAAM